MKNIAQKIREKLIKALGGYTEKEVRIDPRVFVGHSTTRPVERIFARVDLGLPDASTIGYDADLVKHKLGEQLMPLVMDRAKITRIGAGAGRLGDMTFMAVVDIVPPGWQEGERTETAGESLFDLAGDV